MQTEKPGPLSGEEMGLERPSRHGCRISLGSYVVSSRNGLWVTYPESTLLEDERQQRTQRKTEARRTGGTAVSGIQEVDARV